jgi:probable HAF family extracellular repeat protein
VRPPARGGRQYYLSKYCHDVLYRRTPMTLSTCRFPAVLLAGSALTVLTPAVAQNRYTVQVLGPVGNAIFSDPMDRISVNAHGQVAGFALDSSLAALRAFNAQGGRVTDLGTLGGDPAAKCHAINDAGVSVGASGTSTVSAGSPPFTARRAFAFVNGGLSDLGGSSSAAYAVNNAGMIVGQSAGGPVVFDGGIVRALPTVPNGGGGYARGVNGQGHIVGMIRVREGTTSLARAYQWIGDVPVALGTLGGNTSSAEGINERGQVVGWSANEVNENRAFLFENGVMSDLGTLEGESRALAINADGQIVGWSRVGNTARAFLFEEGAMLDLGTIAPLRTGTGVGMTSYSYATSINNRGQIAGIGGHVSTVNGPAPLSAFLLTQVVTVAPTSAAVTVSGSLALHATSTLPGTAYQWRRNGVAVAGATGATLWVPNASASATPGSYSCVVTTGSGLFTSGPVPVRVEPATEASRIVNLSIRASTGGSDGTLIMGFAIGGDSASAGKPLLIRASGPALAAFGVPGVLADPALTVFAGATAVANNDNWDGAEAVNTAARGVGAFLLTDVLSRDAAIYRSGMASGTYSAHVTGNGSASGTVLAEIYDAAAGASAAAPGLDPPRLINVSARSHAGAGDRILIAGIVIAGQAGRTLLLRAIGPGLSPLGVSGVLADPKLELFQGGVLLASNDNWGGEPVLRAAAQSVAAFPLADGASRDAMLLVTLAPGAYTAQVSGADGGTGVAVVEMYEVK